MDLVEIVEMKNKIAEELRKVEAMKQSMEQTLAGLIEWEKNLQGSTTAPVKRSTRKSTAIGEAEPITPANPALGDRVIKALADIQGEFTRSELLARVESDGEGPMASRTYGAIFSKFLKAQRIHCVEGDPEERDSLYAKTEDVGLDLLPLW
jgi:hypothetical protein